MKKKNSKYVAKDFTDRQIVVGQKGFGGEPAGYNGERNFEKQLFAFRKSDFLKFLPTHHSPMPEHLPLIVRSMNYEQKGRNTERTAFLVTQWK